MEDFQKDFQRAEQEANAFNRKSKFYMIGMWVMMFGVFAAGYFEQGVTALILFSIQLICGGIGIWYSRQAVKVWRNL